MPVFGSAKGAAPAWCQMQFFDIVRIGVGDTHRYGRDGQKEKLIVACGSGRIFVAGEDVPVERGANLDLGPDDEAFSVLEVSEPLVLVRMCGEWGEKCGGAGLFSAENAPRPADNGDAVDYEKSTNFDSHYHDCDEFWIVYEGRATAISEGQTYSLKVGDCLATGMGFHHDMPVVEQPVQAVYFETTLEGAERRGHLWDHTHGTAVPMAERV